MVKVNRNRKPNKNLKYDMQTTLIGKHELELWRKALRLLRNHDESFSYLKQKGRPQNG